MNISGPNNKKDLNVELNLLPVFDVLSVCICFLLMTVVWIEVRSIETKQVMGGSSAEVPAKPSLWLTIDTSNSLTLTLKKPASKDSKSSIASRNGEIDWERVRAFIASSKEQFDLAQILPAKSTRYEQVIKLMDVLKQTGIKDIGLSPI